MKRFFPIFGEFALVVLLLLIVSASAISVLSLSPISFEQVLGNKNDDGEVAGEFSGDLLVQSPVSFVPALASEGISFGNQRVENYSYSVDVTFNKLTEGENSTDVVRVINLSEQGEFQVDVSLGKEDLSTLNVFLMLGDKRVSLSDDLFEGKVFPYRFQLNNNEQSFVRLILTASTNYNYPVTTEVTLKKI